MNGMNKWDGNRIRRGLGINVLFGWYVVLKYCFVGLMSVVICGNEFKY